MMPVRILLKSWAIPPASKPSDSSLLARISSASSRSLSVMSRNTRTTPKTSPLRPRIGAPLSAMMRSAPSRLTSTVWFASSTTVPVARTRATGSGVGSRVR